MGIIFSTLERFKYNLRYELSYIKNSIISYPISESKKIHHFTDRHKDDVGFIIANGPSLNNINLDLLKDKITIGMNRIYLKNFTPTYYVVEDHLLAEDNGPEISALKNSTMFIPRDLGYCVKNNLNISYVNFQRRYENFPQFSKQFDEIAYWGGTVSYFALQLAYFLGFKQVYIVGLDHSYTVPSDTKGNNIVAKVADPNHFDPRYFGPGKRYHFPDLDKMAQSYKLAEKIFTKSGRKIYNATPESKLDIFEKVNFKDIIK